METIELLEELGFSKKHAEVFLILYKYGARPASFVAKMIGEERTNSYKILQALVREGFIAENIK